MRPLCFACLFVMFITTMALAQSNPVPLINQSAKVVSPGAASAPDMKAQAKLLDNYATATQPDSSWASGPADQRAAAWRRVH